MKRLSILIALVLSGLGLAACNRNPNAQNNTLIKDQKAINGDLTHLQKSEPLPRLKDSADLRIQNYYYTAEADPNKLWYLVTQGMNGNATGYYTIRGPVENASDQVTNPDQLICRSFRNSGSSCDPGVVGLAEPNGIYPSNSNDHLAILTDGAILRWEGYFQTSDQPFKVIQTPTLSINENAAISSTDTSKSSGGRVPPRH